MTQREFYVAITESTELNADLVKFATDAIAKMDAANEKRKNKPSKTAEANAPYIAKIVDEILTVEAQTASDVAGKLGVSVQKASALLRGLATAGTIKVEDKAIPKKGKQKAYSLIEG